MNLFKKSKKIIEIVFLLLLVLFGFRAIRTLAVNEQNVKKVSGMINKGTVEVTLTAEDYADTIIIDLFSGDNDFSYRFVGYDFVHPGLNKKGDFIIHNNTDKSYTVTDYSFRADTSFIQRTANEMTVKKGLTQSEVAALSGDEWYKMNVDYFGEQNLDNLDTLKRMFGYGVGSNFPGGWALGVGKETSSEMIALAQKYLYKHCQFSFDIEKFPIESQKLSSNAVTLWDYINKTSENHNIVLNQMFDGEIGTDGFASEIGYTNDYYDIGNVYNGAYVDFSFTLTLKAEPAESTVPTEPTEPTELTEPTEFTEPTEPAKPDNPEEPNESPNINSPKTGDNNYLLLWIFSLCFSIAFLTGLLLTIFRKKA